MKTLVLAFLAFTFASTAFGATCAFTTECFESEECSETNFSLEVNESDAGAQLITDAVTVPVGVGGNDVLKIYVGFSEGAMHALSRNTEQGNARYTTHIFVGPLAVTYLGECK